MLKLDSALKSLELVLAGAVTTSQLPFVCSYVDVLQSTMALTGAAETDGASNNTTTVTIVGAPAAGTTRKIDFLSVVNADTVAATVTLQVNNNGTLRRILRVVLDPGDNLCYTG